MSWTNLLQWMLRLFSKSNTPQLKSLEENQVSDSQRLESSLKEIKTIKERNVAISLDAYFSDPQTGDDRRQKYPNDYTNEILDNAKVLLEKVNALLSDHGILSCTVSSGWRPPSVNGAIGGAKKSGHMIGKAIDIRDGTGELDSLIASKPELLRKYGLFLEDPSATKGWCHLDYIERSDRPSRIFKL